MIIPIPLGENYTATLRGAKWKTVQCFNCSGEYFYHMNRSAKCNGFNPLWLDAEGARNRAYEKAQAALTRALDEECDPISCPACGVYQPDMIRLLRVRKWTTVNKWARLILLVHIIMALASSSLYVLLSTLDKRVPRMGYEMLKAWMVPPFGFVWMWALALLLGAWVVRRSYDPNADAASRARNLVPGPDGPFRREEFEQRMTEAAETARQVEDSAKRLAGGAAGEATLCKDPSGQWICSACGTILAPGFMGDCPVCGRPL